MFITRRKLEMMLSQEKDKVRNEMWKEQAVQNDFNRFYERLEKLEIKVSCLDDKVESHIHPKKKRCPFEIK